MANDLTKNPWVLDTTAATSIWDGPVHINQMRWVPAAAGDDLLVTDKLTNTIWTVTDALTGGVPGTMTLDLRGQPPYQGFILATMGGGTLYVYVA